jgi:uncharacterized protein with PIN domain
MSTPTRFVTDSSLDLLARRLRFLGFDIVTHRGARLEELFDDAARTGRTVLTSSLRHPRKWAAVPVLHVERGDVAAALRAVATGHTPATAAWTRCPRCNVALHARSAFEARGEVPGRVTRLPGVSFRSCPSCGQWYWTGSHVARMTAWLEQALGHAIARFEDGASATAAHPAGGDVAAEPPATPPAKRPAEPPVAGEEEPGNPSS